MEIRLKDVNLEYDKEQRKIGGYINVVERPSEILFSHKTGTWFQETMKAGVFTRALQKNKDIPLLLEHDYNKKIANTSDGTLELREDAIGLRFDAIVSEDSYREIEQRGIKSCSFGFKINEQSSEPVNSKLEKRYVSNIDLFEVSLVQNPAYVGSLVEKRALEDALKEEESEVSEEIEIRENEEDKSSETEINENPTTDAESENVENTQEIKEDKEVEEEERSLEVEVKIDTSNSENCEETEDIKEDCEVKESMEEPAKQDVKEDAKEVIEKVIEETKKDAEFYNEMAENVEDIKKEVIEDSQRQLDSLEGDSLYYTQKAYEKWLEVAKLKQIKMNL